MVVVRGIVVVVACTFLFAIAGGFIAAALNWLAPGYYPGVFPHTGYAADVGVGTGILQGLMLGLLVGTVIALGLAWFRQLKWAGGAWAVTILIGCATVFAVGGGLVGLALGTFIPGYYRGVFRDGRQPSFNPTDVGIGLGSSQGVMLGVIVGGVVVVTLAWRRSRTSNFRPDMERVVRAHFEPGSPKKDTDAIRGSPEQMTEQREL